MIAPSRTLAQAEYEGVHYVLEDRGGVWAVGPLWGLGRVYRGEREAWMHFNEATGGASLEIKEVRVTEQAVRFVERDLEEAEDTAPEPSPEQIAEWDGQMALVEASEELLKAAVEAHAALGCVEEHGEPPADILETISLLGRVIEKARPTHGEAGEAL